MLLLYSVKVSSNRKLFWLCFSLASLLQIAAECFQLKLVIDQEVYSVQFGLTVMFSIESPVIFVRLLSLRNHFIEDISKCFFSLFLFFGVYIFLFYSFSHFI